MEERLQKVLRDKMGISRRNAEVFIAEGKVTVNGKIAKLGDKAKPTDDIKVAGKALNSDQKQKHTPKRYFLVYKPVGYTSSTEDVYAERLVTSLVSPKKGLVIAGRLDVPSEGLVLLTDDGDLVFKLTHPKFEVPKEYEVTISGHISLEGLQQLTKGIHDEDDFLIMKKVSILKVERKLTVLKCVLTEGKKREIRRMMNALGKEVQTLKRVAIGPFRLGNLTPGKSVQLSEKEVRSLMAGFARNSK